MFLMIDFNSECSPVRPNYFFDQGEYETIVVFSIEGLHSKICSKEAHFAFYKRRKQ